MAKPGGRLIIVCGLPGSGKTTTARAIAERTGATRFAPDEWMDALALDIWDGPRRGAIEALQWELAQDILALGGTAIIEWGTWGRSERDTLRLAARELGASAELVYLDAPLDELFARIQARNMETPPITFEQLRGWSSAFQRPTTDELALYDSPTEVQPPVTEPKKRVAILISGRGSNMSALIEAARAPDYPAQIVGVFSNKPDAPGLKVAGTHGIATAWRWHKDYPSRTGFELALADVLKLWRPDIIALAGFMRILTPEFTQKWKGRIINIHPSLLPAYRGLDTHARALADRVTEHGCTVHFVSPGVDEGPTILQARVPVLPNDTPETLAERVLAEEHRIYPEALALVARGAATYTG